MGISTNQQRIYWFCRVSKIGNDVSTKWWVHTDPRVNGEWWDLHLISWAIQCTKAPIWFLLQGDILPGHLVNELIMNHGVKSQRVKDLYFQSPFYHHVTGIHQLRSCRVCGNKLAPVFCQRLRTWRTWSIFEQIGLGPFNSTWCSSWFTIWLFNIAMENPL